MCQLDTCNKSTHEQSTLTLILPLHAKTLTSTIVICNTQVAKTANEVRLEEERKAAAEAAAAAQKEAAEKAAAAQKASTTSRGAFEGMTSALAAAHVPKAADVWSEEDEKALWAEWKRLADEKKAAAAAGERQ
jgi:type IV secretory pathway TrbL component